MKLLTKLTISLTSCLLLTCNYVNAATDQQVTYKNQRGSILTLTQHYEKNNTGTLTGTFTSAVGNCKDDVGVPMPITGFFNGNALSITVNFPSCKATVAMAGNLTDNNNELHLLWLDATQANDPVHENWNSNIIGSDSYKKLG